MEHSIGSMHRHWTNNKTKSKKQLSFKKKKKEKRENNNNKKKRLRKICRNSLAGWLGVFWPSNLLLGSGSQIGQFKRSPELLAGGATDLFRAAPPAPLTQSNQPLSLFLIIINNWKIKKKKKKLFWILCLKVKKRKWDSR